MELRAARAEIDNQQLNDRPAYDYNNYAKAYILARAQ